MLINCEIGELGNSVDLILEIIEQAALTLAQNNAPFHLHEGSPNMTSAPQ